MKESTTLREFDSHVASLILDVLRDLPVFDITTPCQQSLS